MKKFMMILITALLAFAGFTQAAEWRTLSSEEAALTGANRVYTVDYSDLTTATTNTAQTLTVSVPDKSAIRFVMMKLEKAFDTGNTNFTGSLAVKIGDTSDDDLYLTSTELASDGTEIWKKFGNTVWNSGQATNVTLAYGSKVYTSNDYIKCVFTPNAEETVKSNTVGRVKFYFNVQ